MNTDKLLHTLLEYNETLLDNDPCIEAVFNLISALMIKQEMEQLEHTVIQEAEQVVLQDEVLIQQPIPSPASTHVPKNTQDKYKVKEDLVQDPEWVNDFNSNSNDPWTENPFESPGMVHGQNNNPFSWTTEPSYTTSHNNSAPMEQCQQNEHNTDELFKRAFGIV